MQILTDTILILAGVLGTGLGGIIAAVFGKGSARSSSIFLAFAAGVMTSIVFVGLIPEAVALAGRKTVLIGITVGIVVFVLLGYLVDYITSRRAHEKVSVHTTPDELFHTTELTDPSHRSGLFRAGMLMLIATGLHHVPEGLAIGAGGVASVKLGLMLALMIALHNIPEGMATAAPLVGGGLSRTKAILLTLAAGSTTALGAIIGIFVGRISPLMIALSLGAAAGAMLYAVFGEIVPQTILLRKDRITTATLIAGILAGLFLAYIH
jgi:ZIP family zinc transporter